MAERTLVIAIFNESAEWSLPEPLVERIARAVAPAVDVVSVPNRSALREALPSADYLAGMPLSQSQFEARMQNNEKPLRWIQIVGSAAESLAPLRLAVEHAVRLTGASPIRAPQAAEHAVACLLALLRGLPLAAQAQLEHVWRANVLSERVRDLDGMTVGLPAADVIGEEIARRLKAFGCEILATSRDPEEPLLHIDHVLPESSLDELLARSGAVILSNPFPSPRLPYLDRPQFSQIKEDALLVDISRGGVVKQSELIRALQSRRLAGAALDVFAHEPLPHDSPLWNMPGVLLTPHLAPASPAYWRRAADVIAHNLQRIESGRPLIGEIDPDVLVAARPRAKSK